MPTKTNRVVISESNSGYKASPVRIIEKHYLTAETERQRAEAEELRKTIADLRREVSALRREAEELAVTAETHRQAATEHQERLVGAESAHRQRLAEIEQDITTRGIERTRLAAQADSLTAKIQALRGEMEGVQASYAELTETVRAALHAEVMKLEAVKQRLRETQHIEQLSKGQLVATLQRYLDEKHIKLDLLAYLQKVAK